MAQRQRQTGSPPAKAMGGKRPYLLEVHRDWLLQRLREKPDLTLHALRATLKKSVRASEQDRPAQPPLVAAPAA